MEQVVRLAHGAGGVETSQILEELLFSRLEERLKRVEGGVGVDFPDDAAAIPIGGGRYLVITVDSYTVNPPFFPGGDIGVLAASGSINDVLMMGGKPIALLDAIVVEEGFPMDDLRRIVDSMTRVLRDEGVALIGGDFKVMPRGQLDKIVIATVGVGVAERLILDKPRPGDKIIVSGYLGDHGAVILARQMGIVEEGQGGGLASDVRPLTRLMLPLVEKYGEYIHAARDPTRGGLAMVLNDWAKASGTVIVVDEAAVPIRPQVAAYANMMGIDPLALASEGAAVLAVDPAVADEVLEFVRGLGFKDAAAVGEVRSSERYKGYVLLRTVVGGLRILEPPRGDLVPRIC
ncbi:hydrogenase formation protein HypE [Thermoproteus uzoniensis 768-20]|uniref:Hydrogenase formation protein HypE n=1 Tax=Thermoproteus uzoniensis (strain 768-20) TaxID=999630 RepID=F2L657_THEU7|nr:hydrogenase expression/formation protein HypE [Thermoproteus uzoniensis]AEA13673.1 hydrogenase formation protein HypE [Thermoproteus uzoniensis 768-20]